MEGYQERIARQIQKEAARNGEDPIDIAHSLKVHTSTVERWFRAERMPQKQNRRDLAKHWGLPLDVFEFDLEAEDEKIRDQLNRIEAKLDLLLVAGGLGLPADGDEDEPFPADPLLEPGLTDLVDRAEEDDEPDVGKATGT